MPVDADGNSADIVMDPISIFNRMNPSVPYELYLGSTARDLSKCIRNTLNLNQSMTNYEISNSINSLYISNPDLINELYNYILGCLKLISIDQYNTYVNATIDEILDELISIVKEGIYIIHTTNNDLEILDIIENIENSQYRPVYSPVSYVGDSGKRITTINNIRIGPMYFMVLEKIADSGSACASSKLNHYNMISPRTKIDKYTDPYRNTSVKNLGETEVRILRAYCDKMLIAELMDRNNSINSHRTLYENILTSITPGNIDEAIDRTLVPFGNTEPLKILNHVLYCSGCKLVYEPES